MTPCGAAFDPYTFTISFKAVLLEGLEVAFIVVTLGSSQGSVGLAAVQPRDQERLLGNLLAARTVTQPGIGDRAHRGRCDPYTVQRPLRGDADGRRLWLQQVAWAGGAEPTAEVTNAADASAAAANPPMAFFTEVPV